jgi:hypothetical protein
VALEEVDKPLVQAVVAVVVDMHVCNQQMLVMAEMVAQQVLQGMLVMLVVVAQVALEVLHLYILPHHQVAVAAVQLLALVEQVQAMVAVQTQLMEMLEMLLVQAVAEV